MKLLQSQPKLMQIQTRLNKQSYLSRGSLPGSPDAKMFLFLQSIKSTFRNKLGYPDRKIYPNLYHWYILMRQFAITSLEKWISNNEQIQDDQLIIDFISKRNQKILADAQIFKKNYELADDQGKNVKSEQYTTNNSHEIEYVMDVKIKEGTKSNMKGLVADFFTQQQIQTPQVQQLIEERRIRIVAKMDPQKYQELKNKISALEGVDTFQSKKKDKRFMTGNTSTSTNFLSDL